MAYNIKGTLNQVTLSGYLGHKPELKYTPAGVAVSSLSIATTVGWKDNAGFLQEKTEWHKVVAWGTAADYIVKHGFKGARVLVVGRNETRSWEDKQEKKHYVTEVIAEQISVLTVAADSSTSQQPGQPAASSPQTASPKSGDQQDLPGTAGPREFSEPSPDDSDDLPF